MKKMRLALLLALMLLAFSATTAFAVVPSEPHPNAGSNNGAIGSELVEPTNRNANDTGTDVDEQDSFGTVIKAVEGHKTHGDYQSNTNSCASCHQTHTAAAGSRLLFANTNFKTCAACHDGTLGFYNVFNEGENATIDGAGTFAGVHGASIHMANETVKINAAPGGNPTNTSTAAGTTTWGANFSCTSCHTPHGSYSDRLLHFNPNGFATSDQVTSGSNTFGNYFKAVKIENAPYTATAETPNNVLIRSTTDGVVKVELYRKANTGTTQAPVWVYNKVVSPWSYGYSQNGQPHFTRLYTNTDSGSNGATRLWYGNTAGVKFDLEKGYAYSTSPAGATKLDEMTHGHISLPYIVKMALVEVQNLDGLKIYKTNQAAYWDGFNVEDAGRKAEFLAAGYSVNASNIASGLGVRMSTYCATCHTDYFVSRSTTTASTGFTYFAADGGTGATRHSTNSDRFSCVRCHYAHGTDANIMIDAEGNTVASLTLGGMDAEDALDAMTDKNPSSALKKYVNMSVCSACHLNSSRASTFKNGGAKGDASTGNPIVDGVQR